jgi:alcohol dehydrogenase (cytochrome c)
MDRNKGQILFAKPYMANINWTKGIDQKTGRPLDYDPGKDLQTYSGVANHSPSEPVRKVCPTILGRSWEATTTGLRAIVRARGCSMCQL